MPKKGIDPFATPEGQRALKRFIRKHPEAIGHHLDALSSGERDKLVKDAARTKKQSRQRSRRAIPAGVRFQVLKRDHNRCHYCGRPTSEVQLEIDHKVPVSRGGTNDPSNLVAACPDCNRGKSDRY